MLFYEVFAWSWPKISRMSRMSRFPEVLCPKIWPSKLSGKAGDFILQVNRITGEAGNLQGGSHLSKKHPNMYNPTKTGWVFMFNSGKGAHFRIYNITFRKQKTAKDEKVWRNPTSLEATAMADQLAALPGSSANIREPWGNRWWKKPFSKRPFWMGWITSYRCNRGKWMQMKVEVSGFPTKNGILVVNVRWGRSKEWASLFNIPIFQKKTNWLFFWDFGQILFKYFLIFGLESSRRKLMKTETSRGFCWRDHSIGRCFSWFLKDQDDLFHATSLETNLAIHRIMW